MDVVIVGAGAAGLMAAGRLREAGLSVVVLEARERTGGRILTLRSPDIAVPVELGAEFLHGDAALTRALLAEAGADVVDIDPEQWEARDGRIRPGHMRRDVERVVKRLDGKREPDRSFADFLASPDARGLPAEAIESARAFVEGFHAADLHRVSERALARDPGLEGAFEAGRVPTGYDRLIVHLTGPVATALRLRHVVERVEWSPGQVVVRGRHEDTGFALEARAALVTVPLALTRSDASGAGSVRFEPAVRDLDAAHRSIAAGDVVRVGLVLDRVPAALLRPHMPDPREGLRGEFFLHTPREPFNVCWPITPPTAPLLLAWAGGGRTKALPRDAQSVAAIAIEGLERATGVRVRSAVRDAVWHDWRDDSFSRGAYSYTVTGGTEPQAPVVADTLFFAGEAFAGGTIGTVEGALETGEKAATQIVAALDA